MSPDTQLSDSRVPLPVCLGFGIGTVGVSIMLNGVTAYLPAFMSTVLGKDAATAGYLLMLSKLYDAFADVAIGHLSDRTRSRWGRRRPLSAGRCIRLRAVISGDLFVAATKRHRVHGLYAGSAGGLFHRLFAVQCAVYGDAFGNDRIALRTLTAVVGAHRVCLDRATAGDGRDRGADLGGRRRQPWLSS